MGHRYLVRGIPIEADADVVQVAREVERGVRELAGFAGTWRRLVCMPDLTDENLLPGAPIHPV